MAQSLGLHSLLSSRRTPAGRNKGGIRDAGPTRDQAFPDDAGLIVFALAAALLLGGALGYTIKPSLVTSGPARVIVVPSTQLGSSDADNNCVIVGKHKAC